MKLDNARKLAVTIQERLAPFCDQIEIAGSIRRARPECGDIDLVLLPKPGQLATIKVRCEQRCAVVTDGPQNCIYRMAMPDHSTFQLDIFIARRETRDLLQTVPGNFGSLLLCRTGSKEHNIFLVEHAKSRGVV